MAEQLDWVGHSQLDLSKIWEESNRVRQKNALAPDSLKLDQIVTSIIDVFADATGKLKKLVARLDQPREARRFQEVFERMAEHVTERLDSYRALVKSLEDMDRAQERRATWRHPDIQPDLLERSHPNRQKKTGRWQPPMATSRTFRSSRLV